MQHWYLIHTKIRQERLALEHLERQQFSCFLPLVRVEKLRRGKVVVVEEALFPRYLFIQLSTDNSAPSWGPIRSTTGVSRLVTFGHTPAKIPDEVVSAIQRETASRVIAHPHFEPGESLRVTHGPFSGLEAIFQTMDAEGRVLLLLEILSKPVKLSLSPAEVSKTT